MTMPARLPKVGSTYYYRHAVPPELRPYLPTKSGAPRTEFMISLDEKDPKKAKGKWLEMAVKVAAQLREAEAMLRRGDPPIAFKSSPPLPPRPWNPFPTYEDYERVEEMERLELEEEEAIASDPERQRTRDAVQAALTRREQQEREMREAMAEHAEANRAPLMELFDAYVAERNPAPATVKRWRPVMEHMKAFLGHDDARRITRKDVVAWKEALLAETDDDGKPLRVARTVKETYVASLIVVLNFAAENDRIKANPAANVTVRVPTKVRLRDPGFSKDEAKTILRAALAPQPDTLSPEHRLARRWIPWLCAYTGARVGEMAQLRAQDVAEIEGIWTLRITPEAGRVKNSKARVVPLHQHLIEQGFLKVLQSKKQGPLFYNPANARGGKAGNPQAKKIGERIGAWVRKLGVDDPAVWPNHGWRHLFKTLARGRLDSEARDTIQGHAMKTEGQKYGVYPLALLAEELAKFPRFDTSEKV
jgi:integrase